MKRWLEASVREGGFYLYDGGITMTVAKVHVDRVAEVFFRHPKVTYPPTMDIRRKDR